MHYEKKSKKCDTSVASYGKKTIFAASKQERVL